MSDVDEPKQWWIYALLEPRLDHRHFGEPRYVGKSIKPNGRLKDHLWEAKREIAREATLGTTYKQRWLRAVLQAELRPEIILLESGAGDDAWPEAERKWIAHYHEQGCRLTNGNAGGLGGLTPTPETLAKMSAALKGISKRHNA